MEGNKPALETKGQEHHSKLTLSQQNDQFKYETKLFHERKFLALQRYLKWIWKANSTPSEIHLEQSASKDDMKKLNCLISTFNLSFRKKKDYNARIDHKKEPYLRCLQISPSEIKTAI